MTAVTARRRLISLIALGLAIGALVAVQKVYFERGVFPGDAFIYLAAGERLNAGHQLYALSPGDRPVDINPPLWSLPLVSPPPIAVAFRLFALLPGDAGGYAWWVCQLVALATSLLMLARARPLLTAAAMLILLFPTVYEIGVGNVNSFLLLGLILIWRLTTTGREAAAGAIGAVMTAVKLTPGITLWWLLVTGRLRAFGAAAVTGVAVLLVSIAGAGLQPHLDYLGFMTNRGVIGTSPLSLGGMARYLGVPGNVADLLPTLGIAVGLLLVLVFRRHPAISFGIAVVTMIYGSPAVSINWYVLLYALLAPLAWPVERDWSEARSTARMRTPPTIHGWMPG
jgi:Glycosyltransferase family 87